MKRLALLVLLVGCTADLDDDSDLDADPALAAIAADDMPEEVVADPDSSETGVLAAVQCTKERYLHIAEWSYVAALGCVNGVCPNGCWGYQRRTSGFTCDYDASQSDRIRTRDGGGEFASYNEIKSLNTADQTAVANCKTQSGHPLRTYAVWNGSGWNNEGIVAAVRFAELYGRQQEASPHFWLWYGNYRSGWSPMVNVSPETGITFDGVKSTVARICSATRTGWAGLYFYDGHASAGVGMSAWKREAIIRGMNYCTTH